MKAEWFRCPHTRIRYTPREFDQWTVLVTDEFGTTRLVNRALWDREMIPCAPPVKRTPI